MARTLWIALMVGLASFVWGCQAERNLDLVREMGNREYEQGDYDKALRQCKEVRHLRPTAWTCVTRWRNVHEAR